MSTILTITPYQFWQMASRTDYATFNQIIVKLSERQAAGHNLELDVQAIVQRLDERGNCSRADLIAACQEKVQALQAEIGRLKRMTVLASKVVKEAPVSNEPTEISSEDFLRLYGADLHTVRVKA